jgi:hypothetical protein
VNERFFHRIKKSSLRKRAAKVDKINQSKYEKADFNQIIFLFLP